MSANIESLTCYGTSLVGGIPNNLIDVNTQTTEVLPATAMIRHVFVHADSALTPGVTISFGITSNSDFFVPVAFGLTTDQLNSGDLHFIPNGGVFATSIDENVIITPSADIPAGLLQFYFEFSVSDDVF